MELNTTQWRALLIPYAIRANAAGIRQTGLELMGAIIFRQTRTYDARVPRCCRFPTTSSAGAGNMMQRFHKMFDGIGHRKGYKEAAYGSSHEGN